MVTNTASSSYISLVEWQAALMCQGDWNLNCKLGEMGTIWCYVGPIHLLATVKDPNPLVPEG